MSGLEVCREWLVPLHFSSEPTWMNGGAILQSRDSRNRMIFEGELNVTVTPLDFTFEKEVTA